MGETEIANIDLAQLRISTDPQKTVYRDKPSIFNSIFRVVHWFQKQRFTGNYRMEVDFEDSDVIQLFKARFGTELDADLVSEHGFTISPEHEKVVLGRIKLADLTIGDRAAMSVSSANESDKTPARPKVTGSRPLLRRV